MPKTGGPTLTVACFAEFVVAPQRLKTKLSKSSETIDRDVLRGRKVVNIRTKSVKGLAMSSLSRLVTCVSCGDRYNSSLALVEPEKYCSVGCEELTDGEL